MVCLFLWSWYLLVLLMLLLPLPLLHLLLLTSLLTPTFTVKSFYPFFFFFISDRTMEREREGREKDVATSSPFAIHLILDSLLNSCISCHPNTKFFKICCPSLRNGHREDNTMSSCLFLTHTLRFHPHYFLRSCFGNKMSSRIWFCSVCHSQSWCLPRIISF